MNNLQMSTLHSQLSETVSVFQPLSAKKAGYKQREKKDTQSEGEGSRYSVTVHAVHASADVPSQ
jgi:hypothetical protein